MPTLKLVTDTSEVTGLSPVLTDIIGQLRDIADYYERECAKPDAGEFSMPRAIITIKVYADGEVRLANVGERLNKFELVGALELAGRCFDHHAGDAIRGNPNAPTD